MMEIQWDLDELKMDCLAIRGSICFGNLGLIDVRVEELGGHRKI